MSKKTNNLKRKVEILEKENEGLRRAFKERILMSDSVMGTVVIRFADKAELSLPAWMFAWGRDSQGKPRYVFRSPTEFNPLANIG